ncbi:hypothetical protein SPRG_16790 [Saprolegnia parasitica CBS 223.65]|uniref:RRM domain-containing protein n=1 Tax=Saprolegnia parasitica (strain CBS 223.65) TaxID=695850 RepID=A0A067BI27_SAPPC|nr:hypothetical protein SPRG_16790 [Saprolegnia parasitica CBS 223.65]KDO17803.1 hypothetical protein SPRG_16790 [Saprolegnia parasitica CBS 223.65]|eukprot:XP_012211488.1 hypothetical protein SPRG_16790 [Saprolegnia parasitica CBS 223.65]
MDDLYGDLPPTNDGSGIGLGFAPSVVAPKPAKKSRFQPVGFTPAKPAPAAPVEAPKPTPPEPVTAEPATPATPSLSWAAKKLAAKFASRPTAVTTTSSTNAVSTPARPSPSPAATSTPTLKTSLGLASFTTVSVTRKPTAPLVDESAPFRANDIDNENDDDNRARPATFIGEIRNEYDPARPNDYMSYVEDRKMRKKQEKVKRDLEERQKRLDRARAREREELTRDLEAGRVPTVATTTVPGGRGRGMNLPAWMTKKIEETTKDQPPIAAVGPSPRAVAGQYDDASEAPRGLGFVAAQTPPPAPSPPPLMTPATVAPTTTAPSTTTPKARVSRFGQRVSRFDQKAAAPKKTVLLLQNMVGPGEVDDDLEGEVKEECQSKYGPVVKCIVYEVTTGVPAHEAVRIFVEFLNESDAAKALAGLHGRFFGGRKLQVSHFEKAKLDRLELAP